MKENKNIAELYLKEVKKFVSLPRKERLELLNLFEDEIGYYLENNPNCTYQDLINCYGTPESAVLKYMEMLGLSPPLRVVKRKRIIITIALCLMATLLSVSILWSRYLQSQMEANSAEVITIYN